MRNRYRSFFWPAVLILVGVFALLVNSGLVAPERIARLVDLWPLILVVIGLELLVRRSIKRANAELAAVLIVAVAISGAAAYVALGPPVPTGTHTLDISGKLGSLTQASVRVKANAAQITMEGADIGADLYRARVVYSGNTPGVAFAESNGDLQILQGNSSGFFFQDRRFALDLKLNTAAIWKIAVDSGASSDSFNLANARVSGIELHTGASREDRDKCGRLIGCGEKRISIDAGAGEHRRLAIQTASAGNCSGESSFEEPSCRSLIRDRRGA